MKVTQQLLYLHQKGDRSFFLFPVKNKQGISDNRGISFSLPVNFRRTILLYHSKLIAELPYSRHHFLPGTNSIVHKHKSLQGYVSVSAVFFRVEKQHCQEIGRAHV